MTTTPGVDGRPAKTVLGIVGVTFDIEPINAGGWKVMATGTGTAVALLEL